MKSILYLFPLLLLAVSCNTKPNLATPEKFIDGLMSSISSQDSAQFNSLFMNDADYDALVKNTKDTEMSSRLETEKRMNLEVIRKSRNESFSGITSQVQSITTWEPSTYDIVTEKGIERISNLQFKIETPDHKQKEIVIRELMKINGQWKSVSYINMEDAYFN